MKAKIETKERIRSAKEVAQLHREISFGLARARFMGKAVTEIWLGPREIRILQAEIEWQKAEGRYVIEDSVFLRAGLEGRKIMGRTLRVMQEDGIRLTPDW